MSNKLFCLIAIVLLALTGAGQAAEWVDWTGLGGDRDWNNGANWENNTAPLPTEWALIDSLEGPILTAGTEVAVDRIDVGRLQEGRLVVDGGSISVVSNLYISSRPTGTGIVDIFSGSVSDSSWATNLNWNGTSILNIYGGSFRVPGPVNMTSNSGCVTTMNINGGRVEVGDLNTGAGTVSVHVGGGVLILTGDDTETMQGLIDANAVQAYNGTGTLFMDYDVANAGMTTLTATHPLLPTPLDGSILSPGDLTLSWTLADDVVKVDVWFSDDVDKINNADPSALLVDQQMATSADVKAELKKRYYWAVDTFTGSADDPSYGPIFSFLADNAPPVVDAGLDYDIFLKDGVRTGALIGSVTDDGQVQPYTVEWTIIEQPSDNNDPNNPDDPDNVPGAVIADPTAEQTTVTLSAVGTYVLVLTADDGEYTSADSVEITAFEDTWAD